MSRNVYFILAVIISAVCAYILNPMMLGALETILRQDVPRALLQSDLVMLSSYVSLMGLSLLVFSFVFPALHVWYYLSSALSRTGELPLACDPLHQTSVKDFLQKLSGLDFIHEKARIYSSHLIQGPEQEVPEEILKEMKVSKILIKKTRKFVIAPVRAAQKADFVFASEHMVDQRVFMWFFNVLPALLGGIGGICLMLSFVAFALNPAAGGDIDPMMMGLQAGVVAIAFCLISAIIVTITCHLMGNMLRSGASLLCQRIDNLFHHDSVHEVLAHLMDNVISSDMSDDMALKLDKTISKPLNAMTRATKALAADQEQKLDGLLNKSLARFMVDYEKKLGVEANSLNATLRTSTKAAHDMEKQVQDSAAKFAKQMDQQAISIARHLSDMQKILEKNEKQSKEGFGADVEKVIGSLKTEMQGNYEKFGKYMDQSLTELSIRQHSLDKAVVNKDNILQDLHKTARDLGMISEASGQLLEKFHRLSEGMETVLKHTGPMDGKSSDLDRGKMMDALRGLQKLSKGRTRELPEG